MNCILLSIMMLIGCTGESWNCFIIWEMCDSRCNNFPNRYYVLLMQGVLRQSRFWSVKEIDNLSQPRITSCSYNDALGIVIDLRTSNELSTQSPMRLASYGN